MTSAGHALGCVEREAAAIVCAPIEAPASTARSMPAASSTASRSVDEVVVAVASGSGAGRRRAVPARVVGDHAVPPRSSAREPMTT